MLLTQHGSLRPIQSGFILRSRKRLGSDCGWSLHSAIATRAWARKAVEWFSHEIGMDTSHVMDMSKIVERPEGHRSWGTREKVELGGP